MSVIIPTKPLISKQSLYSLDIRSAISGFKGQAGNWMKLAGVLDQIQSSSNRLEKAIRDTGDGEFDEIIVRGAGGELIGWIGSRGGYYGAWFKQLYVGGDGPDTAPLFADSDGNVIIGKNGSLELQDGGGNEVGWLGVQADAAKVVTNATNATPVVVTVATHGYEDGDTVFITGVLGNTAANGYRIVQGATTNTFEITDLDGVDVAGSGAYTSGGTATRYFGGGRFQTIAVGTSFTSYKIRAYADGQVKIKDALITLTDVANNGYIELNPSTGPDAIFRNTSTGAEIRIFSGNLFANNYLVPGAFTSILPGQVFVTNSTGASVSNFSSTAGYGTISLQNAAGAATVGLNGSTGTISGTTFDALTAYKIGGVTGVTASQDVVSNVTATTASAVNSVDFGAQTTTSISVVTGITVTKVSRAWTSGLLTT